jgi:hypothetical protein
VEKIAAATRTPRCFTSVSACESKVEREGAIYASAVEWPGVALAPPHGKTRSATCYLECPAPGSLVNSAAPPLSHMIQ